MPGSGTIRLLHLLSFLSYVVSQTLLLDDNMIVSCPGPNNTASSAFISNLSDLVNQKLYNEGGNSPYYNTTYGEYPDIVNSFYLCKFNVSFKSCQNCIVAAGNTVMQKCHGAKEATIWYNDCMVRFSDHSLSFMDSMIVICNYKLESLSVPDNATTILTQSFRDIVMKPNYFNYATLQTKISSRNTLYSFGQCLPVLPTEDCRQCLNKTVSQIPGCFPQRGTGFGRTVTPYCNIGYELYPYSMVPAVGVQAPISPANGRTEGGKSRKTVGIAIGATVGAIIVVVLFYCFVRHKRRTYESDEVEKPNSHNQVQLLHLGEGRVEMDYSSNAIIREKQVESQEFTLLPLDIILEATRLFSHENKLGEGGFGPVYKGILADGQAIAVKRLSTTSGQGLQEFKNEVTVIAKLQHKNLVRLLGCCLEGNELLLVYEYMPNKSLNFWIVIRILKQRYWHCNNGYMAPEYAMEGLFSVKSDVFSFGVLVLEIISGRRNSGFYLYEDGQSLLTYAWKLWSEENELKLMDPVLKQSYIPYELLKCIHIGLLCVQEDPADRPTMSSVVVMLASDNMILPQPTKPPVSVDRAPAKSGQSSEINEVTLSNVSAR